MKLEVPAFEGTADFSQDQSVLALTNRPGLDSGTQVGEICLTRLGERLSWGPRVVGTALRSHLSNL